MLSMFLTDSVSVSKRVATNPFVINLAAGVPAIVTFANSDLLTYQTGCIQKSQLQSICIMPLAVTYSMSLEGCLDGTNFYDLYPDETHAAADTEALLVTPNLLFQFPVRLVFNAAAPTILNVCITIKEFGGTNL